MVNIVIQLYQPAAYSRIILSFLPDNWPTLLTTLSPENILLFVLQIYLVLTPPHQLKNSPFHKFCFCKAEQLNKTVSLNHPSLFPPPTHLLDRDGKDPEILSR